MERSGTERSRGRRGSGREHRTQQRDPPPAEWPARHGAPRFPDRRLTATQEPIGHSYNFAVEIPKPLPSPQKRSFFLEIFRLKPLKSQPNSSPKVCLLCTTRSEPPHPIIPQCAALLFSTRNRETGPEQGGGGNPRCPAGAGRPVACTSPSLPCPSAPGPFPHPATRALCRGDQTSPSPSPLDAAPPFLPPHNASGLGCRSYTSLLSFCLPVSAPPVSPHVLSCLPLPVVPPACRCLLQSFCRLADALRCSRCDKGIFRSLLGKSF